MADKEFDALKQDFETLRRDLANLSDEIKRSSTARARAGVDAARDQFEQTSADVAREVSERPFTTIFAAFGVGFILGKLLDR